MNRLKRFFRAHWFFLSILVAFFFWIFYSYYSNGLIFLLFAGDLNRLFSFVASFGIFAWIVFVFIVVLEVLFVPLPLLVLILYAVGGTLFGAFLGGVLTLVGNLIGAAIAFYIAKTIGREFIERKISERRRQKFDKFTEKYGAWAIFFIRLNPFTSSDIFSYLAGLTKMRLGFFVFATGLGLIPLIFVQTYLGESIFKLNNSIFLILMILSAIYLLVFFYLIFRFFRKK